MKTVYRETIGSKKTILFNPKIEVYGEAVRIPETVIWHDGHAHNMPEHTGLIDSRLWFDPKSSKYIHGKAHVQGAILLYWLDDGVLTILRYKDRIHRRTGSYLKDKVKQKTDGFLFRFMSFLARLTDGE